MVNSMQATNDTLREAPRPRWPRKPGTVFSVSCYIAIVGWAVPMGLGLTLAANHLLSLACLTSLVAGSLWWRVLHRRRAAAEPQVDFMGKEYRESQMTDIILAIFAWVAPPLISGAGWLLGMTFIFVFGFAYFKLTELVTLKWPARP